MQTVETVYPLSPTQQGMLFHSIHRTGTEYFRQISFEIAGELNALAMREAWQSVMDRHAALRTSFLWKSLKEPVQAVHRSVRLDWTELDWTNRTKAECEELLAVAQEEERARGFDLRIPGLFRCVVIRKQPGLWHLIINFHHIILDGWSVPLLMKEAVAHYEELCHGARPAVCPAPAFRDYIVWLRRQDAPAAENFWRDYMAGVASPTFLNVDSGRQAATAPQYEQQKKSLTPELTEELRRAVRRCRVTLNTMVEGAWASLLSRYSGQKDVIFGTVVSGRPQDLPGVEDIAGLFINILPVRVRTEPDTSVARYLVQIQQARVRAQQYEYASLGDIQRWSGLRGGGDLFESILVFQNFPSLDTLQSTTGSLSIRGTQSYERTPYPLTLMVSPSGKLEFLLIHDASRFGDGVAQRMLDHLEILLTEMASQPDGNMAALPMMTVEERVRFDAQNRQTPPDSSRLASTHVLFEQQADRAPKTTAAVFENESLTYGELDRRSNQLAHYLVRRGVRPDTLVAVCVGRSLDMLVALLGILKAGGAYVPLDPEYPSDRLRYMLDDSQASLLIADELRGFADSPRTLLLSDAREELAKESCGSPGIKVSSNNLAYVIYTSGSTGKPKGVMIPHRALSNLLESMRKAPGLVASDRLLAITTLSFDISGLELFLPLISGATVVIAGTSDARDGKRLAGMLEQCQITVMQATPATWRMLIQSGWQGRPRLKVLCGGEALPRDLALQLLDRCDELWNVYGPTETTIWSTTGRVCREDAPISIGGAIDNTSLYIVDTLMRAVPQGATGELCIGGEGLARGYWNRSELTAEKFVTNPFGLRGSLVYRTGDLARILPDGSVECLGRMDHQVKLRGHRIELGEIESALRDHPGVREALVVARESAGGLQLVGYIVPSNGSVPKKDDLRDHLRQSLPAYMVPNSFIPLGTLPLTPNGKVDRKALPPPDQQPQLDIQRYIRPANDFELQLTAVFERVLEIRSVGVTDNFFDLGGHSLLAVRLVAEVEKIFDVNLPVATLIECATVRELAGVLRKEKCNAPWSSLVPLKPEGTAPPFFCVHSLGANLLSYRHLAHLMDPDQPVYGLQPQGLDGQKEIHLSVEEMAAHYIGEIRKLQHHGPYYLGGVCLGGAVAFEMAQQLRAAGQEVGALVLIDSYYAPVPRHMRTRPFKVRPTLVADYYLGDVLLRSPREKQTYVFTRIRNLIGRAGRRVSQLLGIYRRGQGSVTQALSRIHSAHSAAEQNYVPRAYPGKVTLFWCAEFPGRAYQDKRMGWSEVAGQGLEVHVVPGNHFSMLQAGNVEALAEKLNACLQRARNAEECAKSCHV